jgi:hypothetical protein
MIAEHRHSQRFFPVCGRITGFRLNDSWLDRSRPVYPSHGNAAGLAFNTAELAFSVGLVASVKLKR